MFRIRSSLNSVLAVHLVLILLASMLLINIVTIKLFERDAVKARISAAQSVIRTLEKYSALKSPSSISEASNVFSALEKVSGELGYKNPVVMTKGENLVFPVDSRHVDHGSLAAARKAAESGQGIIEFTGRTWGIFWFAYRAVKLALPLSGGETFHGAVSVSIPLEPVYASLRAREKILLLYTALNAFFLALIGTYRLNRKMIRPLKRLLDATEQFTGDEPFPSLHEGRSSEIGQINRSIHAMLKRLEQNKEELKDQLARLEESNRELKIAQKEIITSEKLASVGRLATGVAHEIGNPLGIVLGYLDIIKSGKLDEEEISDFLTRIETEVTKIHMVIRQMLDFSRTASGNPHRISLRTVVYDALSVLEPHPMMNKVSVQLHMKCESDCVWADANQLQQVIINIIINSVDAMADCPEPAVLISSSKEKNMIRLSILDSGPGVENESLGRLFEPFYTSKEPGKGTGMGLAVCYRIIEAAGGMIRAENSESAGLEVSILLPPCR